MTRLSSTLALVVVAAAVGCGGAPPPAERLTSAEAAIRGAQEVGAPNVPSASLSLRIAQESVAKAKALIDDSEMEEADLLLMRAQADAELALALAREHVAKQEATKARQDVARLKGEEK